MTEGPNPYQAPGSPMSSEQTPGSRRFLRRLAVSICWAYTAAGLLFSAYICYLIHQLINRFGFEDVYQNRPSPARWNSRVAGLVLVIVSSVIVFEAGRSFRDSRARRGLVWVLLAAALASVSGTLMNR